MTVFSSLYRRKALYWVVLFIVFFAFTADILDLREELQILSCSDNCLDNNVDTGIISNADFKIEPALFSCSVFWKSSVKIFILHLFPLGLRAPPSWS